MRWLVRERNRVSPERMGAFRRFLDRYLEPEFKEQIEIHLDGLEA